MLQRRLAGLTLVLGLLLGTMAPAQAATEASAIVDRVNSTLIEVMRNADRLGYEGRFNTLSPVLVESFNFAAMARISVGKHWRSLNDEQKKEMVQAFARLSVATFASRFNAYSGEAFEILGEAEQRNDAMLVQNQLIKRSGERVSLNYILRRFDGEWRIIDVYLDAKYSELALKRSEYTTVIKRDGFPGLISAIEQKIDEYAQGL